MNTKATKEFHFPVKVCTTEMHTNGEPFRIVEYGYPPIPGETILDKIKFLKSNLDSYRTLLMSEPRGHSDMFGGIVVTPDHKDADISLIFIDNRGYGTMCGHGVISFARYCVDKGIVKDLTSPETKVNIQCPCGLVEVYVQYDGEKSGAVRFQSVPSFVFSLDVLRKRLKLIHPDSSDLAVLFGTIVTDGKDIFSNDPSTNICVFADRQIDRSPCGSGVTARTAIMYARGYLNIGQSRQFSCLTGSTFTSKPIRTEQFGPYDNAVVVEVSGHGYYTGTSVYTLEEDDAIGQGFLLK